MKDTTPPATGAPVVVDLGADLSPIVKALEAAFKMIQRKFPGTPDATIVVKRDAHAWGHTTVAKTWAPAKVEGEATHFEIMISGENLRRGPVFVAATLLHEAAHARNLAAGIMDCDSNGRHNLKFKAAAEEHGLTVTNTGWGGWTGTVLGDEGQVTHKRLIARIASGLDKSAAAAKPINVPVAGPTITITGTPTGGVAVGPRKRGNRNLLLATCGCGHKIRVSRGVLDAAVPTCQTCNEAFATAA